MACSDEDRGRSRRPVVEDRGWSLRLGGAVCGLHRASGDVHRRFLGSASNPRSIVYEWFSLKTTRTISPGLTSKPVARVSWFGPQNRSLWFGDLGLKITAVVSWFGPQNQASFGLSVVPQNRWRKVGAGHASRSSGLLWEEASQARLFQFGLD
jgi:hypothetical protein